MIRRNMETISNEKVLTFQYPVSISSHIVSSALWTSPCEEILPFHIAFGKILWINGCFTIYGLYGLVIKGCSLSNSNFTSVL